MNAEDEIFLTAYLDGELDSEHRRRVETAMLSDPRLLDRLHALATVREMVAGLPRVILCPDVSDLVTAAIDRRRRGLLAFELLPRGPASWSIRAGAVATAALLLIAVLIGLGHRADHPSAGPNPNFVLVDHPKPRAVPIPETPVVEKGTASPVVAAEPAISAAEKAREADRRRLRDLLDRPESPRMLVVTDASNAGSADKVGKLLEQTSLRNARFGRINISQGIQIDPKHPGEATVFAVIMDEAELRDFGATLRTAFQDAVVESEARPEVVTQLADLTDVSLIQGTAVATLRLPDGPTNAIRTEGQAETVKKSVIDPDGRVDRPGNGVTEVAEVHLPNAAPRASSVRGDQARSREESSPPAPIPSEKSIVVDRRPSESLVLIWVTSFAFHAPGL